MARTAKGWSGPSAIGTGDVGFGLRIGGEVTEFVLVLNTYDAVEAFSREGNLELGAEAGLTQMAAAYTYSISQGLFAGVSLEGTVIITRADTNAGYYGRRVTSRETLAGSVAPPAGAKRLQSVLGAAESGKCGSVLACR